MSLRFGKRGESLSPGLTFPSSTLWLTCNDKREIRAALERVDVQFHGRSVVCTAALADYLGFPLSEPLTQELARLHSEKTFQRRIFFVRNLGFVAPTEARRITYEESLRFEAIHERTYRECGYELIFIEAGALADRTAAIMQAIRD